MPESVAEANAAAAPTPSSAPSPKIDLLDQILVVEAHVEWLEINERYCRTNGHGMGEVRERELRTMRQVGKTLDLLRAYEKQFVEIVQTDRRRGLSAARETSAASSSRTPTTSR